LQERTLAIRVSIKRLAGFNMRGSLVDSLIFLICKKTTTNQDTKPENKQIIYFLNI